MKRMKTSHSSGFDGIACCFIKAALPVVAESLCDIFNISLSTGTFPVDWKVARITPIYKDGPKEDRSNYRPISVLLAVSRLFEKLVCYKVYEFLDSRRRIYKHQSGFRLLHSVVTCLMSNTNNWYLNVDKGKFTGLIFIDHKKTFDTVSHELLLGKLQKYGITGIELRWFTSYLHNRRQFCKVSGSASEMKGINCGVPQGSYLDPLLFLIYIKDLPYALHTKVTLK